MLSRYLFILCFLCSSLSIVSAQSPAIDNEIKQIYKLINYNFLDEAQYKIKSIQQQLSNAKLKKSFRKQLAEIDYLQAKVDHRLEKPIDLILQNLYVAKSEAEDLRLYSLHYNVDLLIALSYEKLGDYELTDKYLDQAYQLYKKHNLEGLFSTYCVRRSSYFRFARELDSMYFYADKAEEFALKYNNLRDIIDSHILKTIYYRERQDYTLSLKQAWIQHSYYKELKDSSSLKTCYNSISDLNRLLGNYEVALKYNDSSKNMKVTKSMVHYEYLISRTRAQIFEDLGNIDSAYFYYKQFHEQWAKSKELKDKVNIQQIEALYQDHKNEQIIRSKNEQMVYIIAMAILVLIGALVIVQKNKKIYSQNKVITRQLEELSRIVEQKDVLLSELQHRIKNNLQHVISLLEIQKESIEFNNVEEIIRENKNRIQSMALLHEKLMVSDSVNSVNLRDYIKELSKLVKESYVQQDKRILIKSSCDIDSISIEKALPVGLILVELISNSIKHAFDDKNLGIIDIEVKIDRKTGKNLLCYTDTGIGYEFGKPSEKGLGMEIIKGLLDQLHARVEYNNNNGFELKICF